MRLEIIEDGAESFSDGGGRSVQIFGPNHGNQDDLFLGLEKLEPTGGQLLAEDLGNRKRKTVEFLQVLEEQFPQQGG